MSIGERKVAFALLSGTMERQELTAKNVREYYALTGQNVSEGTLYKVLNSFLSGGLLSAGHADYRGQGRPAVSYEVTEEGLAIFGVSYLKGLVDMTPLDVDAFRVEANTDLGQFAITCAVGTIEQN